MARYAIYVPETVGDLIDLLGAMMLESPKFRDISGLNPDQNIETEFSALKQSLALLRPKLGDDRYLKLIDMSDRMRVYFEADPDDRTGECLKGRDLILEMEVLLTGRETYLEPRPGEISNSLEK